MQIRSGFFLWFVVLLILSSQRVQGQVLPPHLLCIKNDTLFWENPPNSCGDFISYDIYYSTNPSVSFSLLTSLTNPDTTTYFHENIFGEIRYYYMKSTYDCPGETVVNSDTLDNLLPIAEAISSVSVENDLVAIRWTASPSPETVGYIIYKITDIGTIPIDTVFTDLFFLDATSNPSELSESYYVNALDACGNASLFGLPHQTVFLQVNLEACIRTADLSWTPYQNWPEGAAYQEIWVSSNGNSAQLAATIESGKSTFSYEPINDSTDYCFIVKSVRKDLQDSAWSNRACLFTDIIQPVRNFAITNVTFTEDENILASWNWNTNAELLEVTIRGGDLPDNLPAVYSYDPGYPLPDSPDYLYFSNTSSSERNYIRISVTDACEETSETSVASPILLSGFAASDQANELNWLPLQLAGSLTSSYQLFKFDEIQPPILKRNLSGNEVSFTDIIDHTIQEEVQSCYYLEATGTVILPDSSSQDFISRSNTVCIEREPAIFLPNAFMPRGKFPEFKPIIRFSESIDAYTLEVFDRWGRILFTSNAPETGWIGKDSNGEDVRQGVYPYRIRLVLSSGKEIIRKGLITLLR